MRTNTKPVSVRTHEGAIACRSGATDELRRSVMACMLFEGEFYEDGQSIADRIAAMIPLVDPVMVATIAIEAREKSKLRHVPLLIVREMARHASHRPHVAWTLERVIQRPDELCEFMALYWRDGRVSVAASVKRGLAAAFGKFNAHTLAKYDRKDTIRLRDVLFICHAKPKDAEQDATWKRLIDGTLPTPDTWETTLSAGHDKKEAWTRLLVEKKLGALALLRNLRNILQAQVDETLIASALMLMDAGRVLPFRFIAAARYAPRLEPQLETAMFRGLADAESLSGRTILLIDVSGSMDDKLSDKSEMTRLEAACALAMLARQIGDCSVFTFSDSLVEVPARRGFALRDAIVESQGHSSTQLGAAVHGLVGMPHDRLIVITDEQSHDSVPSPFAKGYIVNVASYEHGVGYGPWTHVHGWSESIIDYIRAIETSLDPEPS